jgi:hypothetical protein
MPSTVTGATMTAVVSASAGRKSLHWFSYVVPPPEPGTGQSIYMMLLNENTLHLRLGEASTNPETWIRCTPSISARGISPSA